MTTLIGGGRAGRPHAAEDTLRMREWERLAYKLYTEVEKAEEESPWPSDFAMSTRLTWMEAGRKLEVLCERDGISRWSYRWPS